MAIQIPNLWPVKQVQVDVLTPLAILRAQANNLNQMTHGLLVGKVNTIFNARYALHHFDVVVPSLQSYTHRLLSVEHSRKLAYPVSIQAQYCQEPDALIKGCTAHSQDEFIELLGKVLELSSVISVLQSLIARSNEVSSGGGTEMDEEEFTDQEGDAD